MLSGKFVEILVYIKNRQRENEASMGDPVSMVKNIHPSELLILNGWRQVCGCTGDHKMCYRVRQPGQGFCPGDW